MTGKTINRWQVHATAFANYSGPIYSDPIGYTNKHIKTIKKLMTTRYFTGQVTRLVTARQTYRFPCPWIIHIVYVFLHLNGNT